MFNHFYELCQSPSKPKILLLYISPKEKDNNICILPQLQAEIQKLPSTFKDKCISCGVNSKDEMLFYPEAILSRYQ